MPFWRGEEILRRGSTLIEPFFESQVDCNAYGLRMGGKYFCTSDGTKRDPKAEAKMLLASGESFAIPPGQFAYLLTSETIKVPHNAMAFISMRTQLKFEGLINVSGFHVDPGYEGKLLYAVFNAGPSSIAISEGERLFKVWFCDLAAISDEESEVSKFRKRPTDGVHDIDNRLIHGMSPPIVSLQGLATDVRDQQQALADLGNSLNARFNAQQPMLDHLNTAFRNITTGLIVVGVGALLAFIFPTAAHEGELFRDWLFPKTTVQKPIEQPHRQPLAKVSGTKQLLHHP